MTFFDYENNLMRSSQPPKRPLPLLAGICVNVMLYLMFLLILVYMTFAPVPIKGNSMLPSIIGGGNGNGAGDTVVVNKLSRTPKYKDIVVVDLYLDGKANENDEARLIIKRTIAVAGDRFAFKRQDASTDSRIDLYVKRSGASEYTVLNEPYILEPMNVGNVNAIFKKISLLPHTDEINDETATLVPSGKVLCLGDNRNDSKDSRDHGLFDVRSLYGRYVCTLKEDTVVNWFFTQFYVTKNNSD